MDTPLCINSYNLYTGAVDKYLNNKSSMLLESFVDEVYTETGDGKVIESIIRRMISGTSIDDKSRNELGESILALVENDANYITHIYPDLSPSVIHGVTLPLITETLFNYTGDSQFIAIWYDHLHSSFYVVDERVNTERVPEKFNFFSEEALHLFTHQDLSSRLNAFNPGYYRSECGGLFFTDAEHALILNRSTRRVMVDSIDNALSFIGVKRNYRHQSSNVKFTESDIYHTNNLFFNKLS